MRTVPWAPAGLRDDDVNYFMDCDVDCYQLDAPLYGHDYAEDTSHYIIVAAEEHQATITAHYPDGSLIAGPRRRRPQRWTLTRRAEGSQYAHAQQWQCDDR